MLIPTTYRDHYEVAKNMSRHTLERALVRDRDCPPTRGRNVDRFLAYQDALREKIAVEHAAMELNAHG